MWQCETACPAEQVWTVTPSNWTLRCNLSLSSSFALQIWWLGKTFNVQCWEGKLCRNWWELQHGNSSVSKDTLHTGHIFCCFLTEPNQPSMSDLFLLLISADGTKCHFTRYERNKWNIAHSYWQNNMRESGMLRAVNQYVYHTVYSKRVVRIQPMHYRRPIWTLL